jgi:hypothetical protein
VAEKTIIEGRNLFEFTERESMGEVHDVRFVRCYWPRLDRPVPLFSDKSSGIEVQGPPTPRNVIFPPDTVFLPLVVNDAKLGDAPRWRETQIPTRPDCYFERTLETRQVDEVVRVKEAAIVKGEVREIEYDSTRAVAKEVEVVRELDAGEAAQMGEVDRVEIKPIVRVGSK